MRYELVELDVGEPAVDLHVAPGSQGVAILMRLHTVPVGFCMRALNGSHLIPAGELADLIEAEAGTIMRGVASRIAHGNASRSPATVRMPPVTIAVCTKDRPAGVERLLQSLDVCIEDARALGCFLEILLVDNASADERTHDVAMRRPQVRYVREPRTGLDFARNRALREARGDILAFLDDDVIVDRYWFVGLADAWAGNQDAAAFTGLVLPMELETAAQVCFESRGGFRRGFSRIRYGSVLPGHPLHPVGAGLMGTGANMAFSTAVLRQLGGFDEALDTGAPVPGGGDLDMFYRVIRAGHGLVYEPRFLVFHQHRRDMADLRRQYGRSWGTGQMCYVAKHLKNDPERRRDLVKHVFLWFSDRSVSLLRQLARRLLGREHVPPSLLLAELWGGTTGLFGGYARSQRRVAEIRSASCQPTVDSASDEPDLRAGRQ